MMGWNGSRPWLSVVLATAAIAQAPDPDRIRVHIGFSSRVIGQSNHNDLTAAMKAWLLAVTRERKVDLDTDVVILGSLDEIVQAMRQKKLDVISLGMDDFLALEKEVPLTGLFANRIGKKITEQFVVLVRRDQGIKGLADLRGQSIIMLDQRRTLLASLWLDTELMSRRLPVGARFFGKVTSAAKPSLAIMPLFFRQTAAVLMNAGAFETACELNPQMAKEIMVLQASPELIPSVGAYRVNAASAAATLYREQALRLGETPGGKLILNLFQSDGIVEVKEPEMRETRALLVEHARLLAAQRKEVRP